MKPILTLTIGPTSSGKTTAVEQVAVTGEIVSINRDDIRFQLFTNGERDWRKYKFTKAREKAVTEVAESLAHLAVKWGKNIIISDTNLNPLTREKWAKFAEENGYAYEEQLFPVTWDELVKRNAYRPNGLPEHIAYTQWKRYMQQWGGIPLYQEDPHLDHCIICDIDGTVADMKGVRRPFEWDKVGQDRPRCEVIAMLDGLAMRNGNVVFMSGRDGVCYEDTLHWLEVNITDNWPEDITWSLVMRGEGDSRKDYVVKQELYEQHILGIFNVAAVLDDRPQVLRLWDVMGLPNIINVGEVNKEF